MHNNTTSSILSILFDLSNQIMALGDESNTIESNHKAKLLNLSKDFSLNKDKITASADKQVRSSKNALQAFEKGLEMQRSKIQNVEANLSKYYTKSNLSPTISPSKFDEQEAYSLLKHICETGFLPWLKKVLSIGGYKSNAAMATDLYYKIAGAYNYLNLCIEKEREKCSKQIQNIYNVMNNDIHQLKVQYDECVSKENLEHVSRIKSLQQKKQLLLSNHKITEVSNMITDTFARLGGNDSDWLKYSPSSNIPLDILLGIISVPSGVASPTPMQKEILSAISCYNMAINCYVIPLTISTNQSYLMYSETDKSNISHEADIFRSFIMRQLKFMPLKSVKVSYIDPINRGTTLGQLSHLHGADRCNICTPFLDTQDISKEIKNIKTHVDRVCDALTKTGHDSVYTYNNKNNADKIPFWLVVINDFPAGFDSQSLDDLQVIINKSAQCGISLLISRKTIDKLENKAFEIVQKNERLFVQHRAYQGKSDTINISGKLYGFKEFINNVPDLFFDEINNCCNYKPPIENDFSHFFSSSALPAWRDATKGLSIPFAVDKNGNIVDFILDCTTRSYGFISGSVGSGKTTLIHSIIISASIHYHPDELEMWLVDFKETEFAFYTTCCPNQIKYVAAYESSEIAYSVMDEIYAEYRRRKEAFKRANVADYVEYRKKHKMPRLFVIIDECHRMAQATAESDNYKTLLGNIVSEVRGSGISLLFCDQSISAGLNGLAPERKDLFAVRLAMRQTSIDEIRETLNIGPASLTEKTKAIINEMTSAVEGGLIYKIESKNNNDINALSYKVDYLLCRALYFKRKDEDRRDFIDAANRRIGTYERKKSFFVNPKREKRDTSVIQDYEKNYPITSSEGERYYIGSAFGLKPCFYLSLKNASAENVLLIGNDDDKRLALIDAIVVGAMHNKRTIVFLVSKTSLLYSRNQAFFAKYANYNNITVYDTFPVICKFIGENSNKIKDIHDELIFQKSVDTTVVICIGLDDIFEKMENSTLNQERAWKTEDINSYDLITSKKAQDVSSSSAVQPSIVQLSSLSEDDKTTKISEDVILKAANTQESLLNRINARHKSIDGNEQIGKIKDSFVGSPTSAISGYRATDDMANLIRNGWKINMSIMLILDTSAQYKEMVRPLKLSDNFNHRIALRMSPDSASDFMAKTIKMKDLNDKNDETSAIYEHMGGREQYFRPFSL